MKRLVVAFACVLMAPFMFAGAALSEDITVMMSIPRATNPFHARAAKVAQAEAEKLGVKLDVVDALDDNSKQLADIEAGIAKGVKGFLIAPISADGGVPTVEAAWNAKIPLVTYDRTVNSDKIFAHAGHDNTSGGKIVGEWLVKKLGGKGVVVGLEGWPGEGVSLTRMKGFVSVVEKEPGITLILREGNLSREKAKTEMENALTAHPQIDGLFSLTEDMMLGALSVTEERGIRPTAMVSYDADPQIAVAICEGRMDAMFDQFADQQVRSGLDSLVEFIRTGKKPPTKEIFLAGKLVTKDNFQDTEIYPEIKDKLQNCK